MDEDFEGEISIYGRKIVKNVFFLNMKDFDLLKCPQMNMLESLFFWFVFSCKNNLCYSLYGGILLGAIRHQDIILGDDDLDVCLQREDYDQFIQLWKVTPPAKYLLQNKENTSGFT